MTAKNTKNVELNANTIIMIIVGVMSAMGIGTGGKYVYDKTIAEPEPCEKCITLEAEIHTIEQSIEELKTRVSVTEVKADNTEALLVDIKASVVRVESILMDRR